MRTGELRRTAFKRKLKRRTSKESIAERTVSKGVVAAQVRRQMLTALRNENDTICGDIVRFRDGMVCRHCHQHAEGRNAQWSHIFVRELFGTRWNSRNSVLLCSDCHNGWWHDLSRQEAMSWARAQLGKGELDQLWAESIALLHDRQAFYGSENARLKAEYRAFAGQAWGKT